ncbi:DHS-like NAD/FAD-binding domain-containing protein [Obba rivulosa]|uniref:DHS-like NAD/FAD-binding domain-containing protein n=1 Tax=Obba rivulosa TaxID=1052685 RepID=A0A8E2ATV8_9APHY|nr:DHS-like NAD/FAD-binding domain-containing protein [Obba rivulosa]
MYPDISAPSNDMAAFRTVLASSRRIIAIAGAGLSAASGIPTFRGAGGMWRKHDALSLATMAAFRDSPSRIWQFYHYRRETALEAHPNAAHHALAELTIPTFREKIAPGSAFTLVTQNVDALSPTALETVLAHTGATLSDEEKHVALIEMDGRIFDVVCTAYECKHREEIRDSPLSPALAGTEELVAAGAKEPDIPHEDLPRCRKCGALARPGVVWFGEIPHRVDEILSLVDSADLCLVVGTSSTVHPAARFARQVREHGGKVAVFNIDRTKRDTDADFLFLGPCEMSLTEALSVPSDSA